MSSAVGDLRDHDQRQTTQQLALLPEDVDAAEAALEERRGPGRPAGAVNRATRKMREYILRNYTDPAAGLAASGLRSTLPASILAARALAAQLGCKSIEALEFMRKCSEALMPYTHSKQPIDVHLQGKVAALHIGLGAGEERVSGDAVAQLMDEFARGAVPVVEDLSDLENDEETST